MNKKINQKILSLIEYYNLLNIDLLINNSPINRFNNIQKLSKFNDYVDNNFVTTDPETVLNRNNKIKNLNFFFIPVDKNIETYNVYNMKPKNDLFYAMSHGVNLATLKIGKKEIGLYLLIDEKYKNLYIY